jgi:hypothetical protein
MVVFIASEKHRSIASPADTFEADNVAVELFRAIEVADVQLYIAQFSIADHGNAPSLMSPFGAGGTKQECFSRTANNLIAIRISSIIK